MIPNNEPGDRLSQIETNWTLLIHAHSAEPARADALARLLPRYCRAIYRYLTKVAGSEVVAEELSQEFALRFVRGDFRHAQPAKGRFRDYVKVAVLNLVSEYRRTSGTSGRSLADCDISFDPEREQHDELISLWRQELLNRAWEALALYQTTVGGQAYTLLRLKADEPHLRSAELASRLSLAGERFTEVGVRQALHRARERFAELLLTEVACSIPSDSRTEVIDELAELGLLELCRSFLPRHQTD